VDETRLLKQRTTNVLDPTYSGPSCVGWLHFPRNVNGPPVYDMQRVNPVSVRSQPMIRTRATVCNQQQNLVQIAENALIYCAALRFPLGFGSPHHSWQLLRRDP
jgi:hypothetical protein